MQRSSTRKTPSAWRDMQRDWRSWSRAERLAASTLCLATCASALFYSLISANVIR